jgi:hypothetical protein
VLGETAIAYQLNRRFADLYEVSVLWRQAAASIPSVDTSFKPWFVEFTGFSVSLLEKHRSPSDENKNLDSDSSNDKSGSILDSIDDDDPVGDACDQIAISDCVSSETGSAECAAMIGRKLDKIWCKATDMSELKRPNGWLNGRVVTLFAEHCATMCQATGKEFEHVAATTMLDVRRYLVAMTAGCSEQSNAIALHIREHVPEVCRFS